MNFFKTIFVAWLFIQFSLACTSTEKNENTVPISPESAAHSLDDKSKNKYFIGQDLGAVRGYVNSGCCVKSDGVTTYLSLYNLLSKEAGYGGLGLNPSGKPISLETTWGSGPMSAYKSATEFGHQDLAVGLFIAENDHPGAMSDLIEGKYDDEIRQINKLASFVDGKLYLRIGYEFDGLWNTGHDDTVEYKAVWRRIVDILEQEGANNIIYVWQASAAAVDDAIEKKYEDISQWYPGDNYVDWMALSWFMNPDEMQSVKSDYDTPSARLLADELLAFARQKQKPVMIAEAAPQSFDLDKKQTRLHSPVWDGEAGTDIKSISSEDIWDYWYAPLFDYMTVNNDVIDAIAYINVDWDSQPMWGAPWESGFWGDTRIERDEYITQQWNKAMTEWREEEARQ